MTLYSYVYCVTKVNDQQQYQQWLREWMSKRTYERVNKLHYLSESKKKIEMKINNSSNSSTQRVENNINQCIAAKRRTNICIGWYIWFFFQQMVCIRLFSKRLCFHDASLEKRILSWRIQWKTKNTVLVDFSRFSLFLRLMNETKLKRKSENKMAKHKRITTENTKQNAETKYYRSSSHHFFDCLFVCLLACVCIPLFSVQELWCRREISIEYVILPRLFCSSHLHHVDVIHFQLVLDANEEDKIRHSNRRLL